MQPKKGPKDLVKILFLFGCTCRIFSLEEESEMSELTWEFTSSIQPTVDNFCYKKLKKMGMMLEYLSLQSI